MIRNPLLLAAVNRQYQINQSLRFRASNSAFLSYTEKAGTSRRIQTFNFKHKRTRLGYVSGESLFFTRDTGASPFTYDDIRFDGSDRLTLYGYVDNSGMVYDLRSTRRFRDPTAWLNITVVFDTPQATAANRVRAWVGNEEITSWEIANFPAQNADLQFGVAGNVSYIGRFENTTIATDYADMYQADIVRVDGQALTPASFGQIDPLTNSWVPRRYTGTYGTNGCYLPFDDATSTTTISQDRSGNGNNWTSSGISVTSGVTFDQMLDSPTNGSAGTRPVGNYATLNPLSPPTGATTLTYSQANLSVSSNGGTPPTESTSVSTINFPSTGKFYAEMVVGTVLSGGGANAWPRFGVAGFLMGPTGQVNFGGTAHSTFVANDVMNLAWDATTGKIWWGKNGTWLNAGDPVAGTGNISTFTYSEPAATVQVALYSITATSSATLNFGQRPFAYTPPTGFLALCTANLPTPTIQRGDDAFQATLRTGTGATTSVSSLRFQPDLLWIKRRDSAGTHVLTDAVRGPNSQLFSNQTVAEETQTNALTAFNSNGYSLGNNNSGTFTQNNVNFNTATYVDWAWREGAAYGFDIVTYTGNGANRTIAHGLNAVPHMMIVKNRDTANGWSVYHRNQNATPQNGNLVLNSTAAYGASSEWNSTAPTSSVFSVGSSASVNGNTNNIVAYLWTSIPGFSLFGSYTGNGSTDGPFVWCGFRPRWVMLKRADAGPEVWQIRDAARNPFNLMDLSLLANASNAEVSTFGFDGTANGFKIRTSDSGYNASGGTYIFAAFAETPFKTATAR